MRLLNYDETQAEDVLSGRSQKSQMHQGTLWLKQKASMMGEEYRQADRKTDVNDEGTGKISKESIINSLVEQVHGRGGRFLRELKGCLFVLMSRKESCDKVSGLLRRFEKIKPCPIQRSTNSQEASHKNPTNVQTGQEDLIFEICETDILMTLNSKWKDHIGNKSLDSIAALHMRSHSDAESPENLADQILANAQGQGFRFLQRVERWHEASAQEKQDTLRHMIEAFGCTPSFGFDRELQSNIDKPGRPILGRPSVRSGRDILVGPGQDQFPGNRKLNRRLEEAIAAGNVDEFVQRVVIDYRFLKRVEGWRVERNYVKKKRKVVGLVKKLSGTKLDDIEEEIVQTTEITTEEQTAREDDRDSVECPTGHPSSFLFRNQDRSLVAGTQVAAEKLDDWIAATPYIADEKHITRKSPKLDDLATSSVHSSSSSGIRVSVSTALMNDDWNSTLEEAAAETRVKRKSSSDNTETKPQEKGWVKVTQKKRQPKKAKQRDHNSESSSFANLMLLSVVASSIDTSSGSSSNPLLTCHNDNGSMTAMSISCIDHDETLPGWTFVCSNSMHTNTLSSDLVPMSVCTFSVSEVSEDALQTDHLFVEALQELSLDDEVPSNIAISLESHRQKESYLMRLQRNLECPSLVLDGFRCLVGLSEKTENRSFIDLDGGLDNDFVDVVVESMKRHEHNSEIMSNGFRVLTVMTTADPKAGARLVELKFHQTSCRMLGANSREDLHENGTCLLWELSKIHELHSSLADTELVPTIAALMDLWLSNEKIQINCSATFYHLAQSPTLRMEIGNVIDRVLRAAKRFPESLVMEKSACLLRRCITTDVLQGRQLVWTTEASFIPQAPRIDTPTTLPKTPGSGSCCSDSVVGICCNLDNDVPPGPFYIPHATDVA